MLGLDALRERLDYLREQERQATLNLAGVKGAIQQVEMFIAELEGLDPDEAPVLEVVNGD